MKVSKRLYGDKQQKLHPLGQKSKYFLSYKYANDGIPMVTCRIITIGEMEGDRLWEYINESIKNTIGQEKDYHITALNKL